MCPKLKKSIHKFFQGWIGSIILAFIIAMTFKSIIADWNDVPSGSMRPTIVDGDRIFVNKLAFDLKIPFWPFGKRPYKTVQLIRWSEPKRGDIVVFFSPADGMRLVKRVVGLPGDTIEMQDNFLLINGEKLPYESADASAFHDLWESDRLAHHFYRETIGLKKHAIMIKMSSENQEEMNNSFILTDPNKFKKILTANAVDLKSIENNQDAFPGLHDSCMLLDPVKLSRILDPHEDYHIKTEAIINTLLAEKNSVKIAKNHYLMIGDNRTNSRDSRFWGFADRRQIVGRAVAIAISREGSVFQGQFRWHRFFKKLI